jgi:rare lipoprotein A
VSPASARPAPRASPALSGPSAPRTPSSTSADSAARPAASTGLPVPVLDRGYWLQLGAFRSAGNAGAARERLGRKVGGLGASLDVVPENGLFKLRAGPWATRDAAQAAAERVRAVTGMEAFATQR